MKYDPRVVRGVFRYFAAMTIAVVLFSQSVLALSINSTEFSAAGPAVLTPDQKVIQALSRLTFGARPGDFERVKKIGVAAFIEEQLNPDNIDDSALFKRSDRLPTLNLPTPTLAEQYNPPKPVATPTPIPNNATAAASPANSAEPAKDLSKSMGSVEPPAMTESAPTPSPTPTPKPSPTPVPKNPGMVVTELQRAKLLRAVYSERQLYEMMVDFWENHFSIYANKDADRWMLTAFDRDSVRPFAFGRFRDLLGATAHSPAMLFYLDNWQSSMLRSYPATKDKPARTSGGINENYARELLELHTMGVDGGYTQKDVQEVARCFTGWSVRRPQDEGMFIYNPNSHDNGEKTVLGVKIPAGGGIGDAERVLDILAKSPATAKFISTKLARKFLGDNPSPIAVARAAKTFLATDGSITATLRSIITGPEFFSPANYQSKVKSPFEFVASALRITKAETNADRPVLDWIQRMGQPVFGRVTPDGYPDMSSEWLSNNDLIARLNFASAMSMNTLRGTTLDSIKLIAYDGNAINAAKSTARALLLDQASPKTRGSLEKLAQDPTVVTPPVQNIPASATNSAAAPPKPPDPAKAFTGQLIALALGAPEFQRK